MAGWLLQEKLPKFAPHFFLLLAIFVVPRELSAVKEVDHGGHPAGLAEDAYDQPPLSYIYGSVVEESLIRDGKGKYATNITFQPRYVSKLFTRSLLFCGNRTDVFEGVQGPVVVTYERIAHKLIREVPCFDLLNVDPVEPQGGRSSK